MANELISGEYSSSSLATLAHWTTREDDRVLTTGSGDVTPTHAVELLSDLASTNCQILQYVPILVRPNGKINRQRQQ
jgi:hypothetical protein